MTQNAVESILHNVQIPLNMLIYWCLCFSLQPETKTEGNAASGSSPAVFVSVLVAGLLLAAIIVGIYYFKCHRGTNGKGMKLVSPQMNGPKSPQKNIPDH